jgi:hypothetical protein
MKSPGKRPALRPPVSSRSQLAVGWTPTFPIFDLFLRMTEEMGLLASGQFGLSSRKGTLRTIAAVHNENKSDALRSPRAAYQIEDWSFSDRK